MKWYDAQILNYVDADDDAFDRGTVILVEDQEDGGEAVIGLGLDDGTPLLFITKKGRRIVELGIAALEDEVDEANANNAEFKASGGRM